MDIKQVWPDWEVVRKIGSGSFGDVYEIKRDMFGVEEKAALKVITIPKNSDEIDELRSQGNTDPEITKHYDRCMQQIVQEYAVMAQIRGHANVVNCEDVKCVHHEDGIGWAIYIKMELLHPLMKSLNKVESEAQIIKLGEDICNALVRCKERNIIHRDIKPQNIFVADNGDFKLGDFGIAKTVERTTGGTRIGTYKYMAPEVYNNYPYGSAADVYSLGLVLYWLLNEKRTPFLPMPPQIPSAYEEETAGLRRFRGEVIPAPKNGSPELKRIVLKACAYSSVDRYASAAEMLQDLRALKNAGPAVAAPIVPSRSYYEGTTVLEQSGAIRTNNPAPYIQSVRPQQPYAAQHVAAQRQAAPMRPAAVVQKQPMPVRFVPVAQRQPVAPVQMRNPVQQRPGVVQQNQSKSVKTDNKKGSKKGIIIVCVIVALLIGAVAAKLIVDANTEQYASDRYSIAAYEDAETGLEYRIYKNGTKCAISGPGTFNGEGLSIPRKIGEYKVAEIGDKAFENQYGIIRAEIPDTVKTIGKEAFYYCTELSVVTIPNSVESIGEHAFANCYELSIIYYDGTESEWNAIEKGEGWNDYIPNTCMIVLSDGYLYLF